MRDGNSTSLGLNPFLTRFVGTLASFVLPILLLCSSHSVEAAQLTLLTVNDFAQSVGGSYAYANSSSGSPSGKSSNSSSNIAEYYGMSASYSILTPRLLKGSFSVTLGADQQSQSGQDSSSKSSSNFLNYNVSGLLFSVKPYPINFIFTKQQTTINPAFTSSYTNDTENVTIGLALHNKFLPAHIQWSSFSTQSSGLNHNFTSSATSTSGTVSYGLGISNTSISLSRANSESKQTDSTITNSNATTTASIANSFNWFNRQLLERSLLNTFSYDKATGDFNSENNRFSSTLQWRFGKALTASAGYSYGDRKTDLTEQKDQSYNFNITHRLFQSLVTNLNYFKNNSQFNDGTQSGTGYGVGISYNKKLPESSSFTASYAFGYAETERNRTNVLVPVVRERYNLPPPDINNLPRSITLLHPSFVSSTIRVYGGVGDLTSYSSPADYSTTALGIEIPPTSQITTDNLDHILITYSYTQDPTNVAYASVSHSIGTQLSLYNGKHLLYANYQTSQQTLLHGEATDVTLAPSKNLTLGISSRLAQHFLSAEYGWNKNAFSEMQYVRASWSHQRAFLDGTLITSANDRYTEYLSGGSSGNNGGAWQNFFSLSSGYNRIIFSSIVANLRLGYTNSYSDSGIMTHSGTANLNLDGRFGRTTVRLNSNYSETRSLSTWSRSESISVSVNRSF